MNDLRTILLTGASGFIGRHFVLANMHRFKIFCLARRSQTEVDIPSHQNITWLQADIADQRQTRQLASCIRDNHGIDCVLHLAGYYDFSQKDNPAYTKTNVLGTRNILELARQAGARHFIFSSSLAACEFTPPGVTVTESSPLSADFPYARSKREAEEIVAGFADQIPASLVRLGAVFSDWCEYPPLYSLLETWLSRNPLSRVIGGGGGFALPYIHIKDVLKIFLRIMERVDSLSGARVYLASPVDSVSHRDIYDTACRYFYNRPKRAVYIPKWLAWPGLVCRCCLGGLCGARPFERPWMARYIDSKLTVDPRQTYTALNWKPTPRYDLLRRLLFIIENKKIHAYSYQFRNQIQLQRFPERKTVLTSSALCCLREEVVVLVLKKLVASPNILQFFHYQRLDMEFLRSLVSLLYQLIVVSIRTRDRSMISDHIVSIAAELFQRGFSRQELVDLVLLLGEAMRNALRGRPELHRIKGEMSSYLELTVQYSVDEIRDVWDQFQDHPKKQLPAVDEKVFDPSELQQVLLKMEHLYQVSL